MALAVVSAGAESLSAPGVSLSFEPKARVISSDQPFPEFSVRRYAERAADTAVVERLEDGRFFAESDLLVGVWGDGDTEEEARREFIEAVMEWVSVKIDQHHGDIPVIGSLDLNRI